MVHVHPTLGRLWIAPVEVERTFPLRQQVLRPHQRVEDMSLPGTYQVEGAVMGALRGTGEVVGMAAVTPEAPPPALGAVLPPGRTWRLRSMATRPDARAGGVGRALIEAILAHVERHGGGVMWCSARTPAVGFYQRVGFSEFGEPWLEDHTGPHVLMWRTVA